MSAIKVIFVYGNSKYGVLLPSSQSKKTALLKYKESSLPGTAQKPSSLVEVNRLLLLCPPYYRKLKLSVKHGLIINPARCSDALLGTSLW